MNSEERLIALFQTCGLKAEGLNYGEIRAYCAGLECVKRQIDKWKNHLPQGKMMIPADMDTINSVFEGCSYTVNGRIITFTEYDIDTIGKKCEDWIGFIMTIEFGGNGLSWKQIAAKENSWNKIHSKCLRWSMIRSIKNGQYI